MQICRSFIIVVTSLLAISCVVGGDQQSGTNVVGKASETSSLDEESKRELLEFPNRGLETNGLACAVLFDQQAYVRPDGIRESPPSAIVHILNLTNFQRVCLNLPKEALIELNLSDSHGNEVEKTTAGKAFKPWTNKQIDDWFNEERLKRVRGINVFLYPWMSSQIKIISLPAVFQLKEPGEFTLHLRMTVIQYTKKDASGNLVLETTRLPEVAAPVHVSTEDINAASLLPTTKTNSPAK